MMKEIQNVDDKVDGLDTNLTSKIEKLNKELKEGQSSIMYTLAMIIS